MFGYVLPNTCDLSEAEQARYQQVYCGVCRSLRTRYGQIERLTVSYDMTFLTLLLNSLYEAEEEQGQQRCPTHPTKMEAYSISCYTDYAADMGILLAYYKCLDDWQDDRKISARVAAAGLSGAYQRCAALHPQVHRAVQNGLAEISAIEKDTLATNPDAPANVFGALLGTVFAPNDDFWATDLRRFGARLGKFLYLMDAALDYEEDVRAHRYNPLVLAGIGTESIRESLELIAASAADAFERLPLEQDMHLLRSVVYAGIWRHWEQQMQKEQKENKGGVDEGSV